MKITAIILALLITLLAIEPSMKYIVSGVVTSAEGCCNTNFVPSSDDVKGERENSDCDGKKCNPFQVCNSCILLVNKVMAFYSVYKPNTPFKQTFSYQSTFSSKYISDCWHPPKIA